MYLRVKCTAGQALWHGGFYHSRGCICCRAAEFLSCLMLLPWDELQQKQLIVRGHKMQCKGLQAQMSVSTNRDHSIVCEKSYDSSTHKRIPPVLYNKTSFATLPTLQPMAGTVTEKPHSLTRVSHVWKCEWLHFTAHVKCGKVFHTPESTVLSGVWNF